MTPIYRTILGDAYQHLPQPVQDLHDLSDHAVWRGTANIQRGRGLAGLFGTMMSMPPAGEDIPVTVTFTRNGKKEIWQRDFAGACFSTRQWAKNGFLYESLRGGGLLVFRLVSSPESLTLVLEDMRMWGIPVRWLLRPEITATESVENGRFCFDVRLSLWPLGFIVAYHGTLEPTDH